MKVVIDIEANSLVNPKHIWVIVCKDIDKGDYHVFRLPTEDSAAKEDFLEFVRGVDLLIGHNILGYDLPILHNLLGMDYDLDHCCDTLILSRLINYSREGGHSIESYGKEFGIDKIDFNDFKQYSKEMEEYCVRDVDINHKVYLKYLKYYSNPLHKDSIGLEHKFQSLVVNNLRDIGFYFNTRKALGLLKEVEDQLAILDKDIEEAFPPKLKLVREITPKETKHGTLSKTDFRWLANKHGEIDLSDYNGGPFSRCSWQPFNPSSPKQIVDVLRTAGWKPTDKTKGHIETERRIARATRDQTIDLIEEKAKLEKHRVYGYKVNETNLETLPEDAPAPARSLAKRILYESRRRTLTEWLEEVQDDSRIHGKFLGIGAWTHRMAHQEPNMANIPNSVKEDGSPKLFGKEFRSLWQAPRNRLLVGVDAESIQLRVFAHMIDDKGFTDAVVNGKKATKTDPHSFNQQILGRHCKSRQSAKRFIYALLLGAGINKLREILGSDEHQAKEALNRLMEHYTGWASLKRDVFPTDARRGYLVGLDGRKVAIPGSTTGERKHLCMSGYLQSGEAIVMKMATLQWMEDIDGSETYRLLLGKGSRKSDKEQAGPIASKEIKLVNMVHDEWQTEVPNNMELALWVAETQSKALEKVGEKLALKCPMKGSYWNEDHNDYTIGTNWYQTH